jgi:CRP/FNR family transcriptional regulator/CRP/FNR family cyclic AMP-dependent transcriptional regulator
MQDQLAAMMTEFPLLRGFTVQGTQRLLDRGAVREFVAGELIFNEGDAPAAVLLVLNGALQVFVERNGGDIVLADVGAGAVLGELAVLCGIRRSASVRALKQTLTLQWDALSFRNLLLRYPLLSERIFKESLRTLVEKERSLIDSVAALSTGSGRVGD